MNREKWNQSRLLEISGSYWQACALHTAVKLDIFTCLGRAAMDAPDVARRLRSERRGTAILLHAMVAMGLLTKEGSAFRNTEESTLYLSRESSRYIGHMVMHHHHLVEAWSRLDEAVLSGMPARKRPVNSDEERESFLMGMLNLAMGIAPHLVHQIDLSGKNNLLDLGGGPGTYSIHFCLANPGMKATVFDLPSTRPFAVKTIQKFGLSDRIDFVAGDYIEDDIPGSYDVVWLSHVLHSEGPEICQRIIDKAVTALRKPGLILIHDFLLNENLDGPLFPALFSLNMLVNTEHGQSYSEGQVCQMLSRAGIGRVQRHPFEGPNQSGIIIGEC
jgi:predicted O-methyltransferase YrrM